MNALLKGKKGELQIVAIYQAPDIVPQGAHRLPFSVDAGARRQLAKGRSLVNATDLFGTLVIRKRVTGDGFHYQPAQHHEQTQVVSGGMVINLNVNGSATAFAALKVTPLAFI